MKKAGQEYTQLFLELCERDMELRQMCLFCLVIEI